VVGDLLHVDTFTAERQWHRPHQISPHYPIHTSCKHLPAPKGTARLAKGLSKTTPLGWLFFCKATQSSETDLQPLGEVKWPNLKSTGRFQSLIH
jgi:hypothetical protein